MFLYSCVTRCGFIECKEIEQGAEIELNSAHRLWRVKVIRHFAFGAFGDNDFIVLALEEDTGQWRSGEGVMHVASNLLCSLPYVSPKLYQCVQVHGRQTRGRGNCDRVSLLQISESLSLPTKICEHFHVQVLMCDHILK